jgi:hypothetical protein
MSLFHFLQRRTSSRDIPPPPPGDPGGGVVYLRIVLSPGEASRTYEWFVTAVFYGEELLAPRPTPKLEDDPSSAVRDCLFNLFAATLHIGGHSSIRNLRTRHAVMTGTHLHGDVCTRFYSQNFTKNKSEYKENKECRIFTEQPAFTPGNTVISLNPKYFEVIFVNFLLYRAR